MTRLELAIALGGAVLAAAALGALLHAVWAGLTAGRGDGSDAADALALQLAEAEEARDALQARLELREAELLGRLEATESELKRERTQRAAELEAVMDTIGALRRELEEARRGGAG